MLRFTLILAALVVVITAVARLVPRPLRDAILIEVRAIALVLLAVVALFAALAWLIN